MTQSYGKWRLRALVTALIVSLVLAGGAFSAFADPGDEIPAADLLDVDFAARAAADLSDGAHSVTGGTGSNIVYDDELNKYVATFSGNSAETFSVPWSTGDYAKSNDSLTIESVFKAEPYTGNYQDFFGNMQSAGIGFEISRCATTTQEKGNMEVFVRKYNNGVSGTNAYLSPTLAPGATGCFNFGEWTHAAITYDGAAVKLYINGVEVGSWAMTGPIVTPGTASRKFVIGADVSSSGNVEAPLQNGGAVSTARIYDSALTAEQIAALAARDLAPRAKANAETVTVQATNGSNSITTKGGSLTLKTDILPLEADNRFEWSVVSGAEYAEFADGSSRLTAKADGTVTVRATATDGSGVFGEMSILISGQNDGGTGGDTVRFGVISDTHVTATKTVQQQRLAKAFNFFSGNDAKTPIEPVEKMVVVGDLTDNGVSSEMDTWGNIKNANLEVPLQAGMGNHENNRWAEYESATGNKANYVTTLNGYTFITLSPGSGSIDPVTGRATGNGTSTYAYAVSWLEEQLQIAEAASPDKPIFVFFHHPIRGTFYVSNEWNGSGLENVFKTHPRAVTFAGHIHSPNNISTSIWQDGGYTAVNTVSTSYFELERGMIYGSVPPNASQCAQGLLVEANDSSVTIKNYDILADAWIDQTWTFDVDPENRSMPYTQANLGAKAVAPVFPQDAEITVSNQRERQNGVIATFTFDQAEIPATHAETMGDIVHSYRYNFVNKSTNTIEKSFTSWSDWYMIPMPAKYTLDMGVENEQNVYLTPGTDYELQITAIDAFGKESATPLKKSFTTLGQHTEKTPTPMNFGLKFEDGLSNANYYPNRVSMVKDDDANINGTASYEAGKNGKAIHVNQDNFVQLENVGNDIINYNQSFTIAYWVNFKDFKINGSGDDDPGVISNKNWASGGNNGFIYNMKQGRLRLNWTPVSGSRHDTWADPNGQTAKDTWMHIAATFDKATDTVTMYYNGVQVDRISNAGLSSGMAGDGNPTLLGNSHNGSGYYNRTGSDFEMDMLLDDFVLVNDVYSSEQISALAADGADIKRSLIKVAGEFPETVYKNEAIGSLPSFTTTVPNAKLMMSVSVKDGGELYSTAEPVEEIDLNTVITPEVFDYLPLGEYEIKVEARDAGAPLTALETRTFNIAVKSSRSQVAKFALAGPASATERDEFDYKVSLSDVDNAGTVILDLSYSDNLEMVGATALGDKVSVLKATDNGDGTARVVLWATVPGATITDAEDILKLTVKAVGEGAAKVAIEGVTVNAYVKNGDDFDDAKKVDAEISEGKDAVDTTIKKYYDPYDFNRDGAVDLLDLTYAQLYYQVSEGDAKWVIVSERGIDVNGDKTVDVGDLIQILNHIYSL